MLETRQRSWILKLNKYSYVNEINIKYTQRINSKSNDGVRVHRPGPRNLKRDGTLSSFCLTSYHVKDTSQVSREEKN